MITRTIVHPSLTPSAPDDEVVAKVQTPEHTGTGVGHGKEEAIAAAEADLEEHQRQGADGIASDDEGTTPGT